MAEKKAPAEKAARAEIGFDGGQVIAARLDPKQLAELKSAAAEADGWHTIETEDGELALDLAKVVFIRAASPEHRVGFTN